MHAVAHRSCAHSRAWFVLAVALAVGVTGLGSWAHADHYDYDVLGRLSRWVDNRGRATEYVYDAVGNILEVRTGGAVTPPAVAAVDPPLLRRGESRPVVVSGSGLFGTRLRLPDRRLSAASFSSAADGVAFDLDVAKDAPLGAQVFTLENAAGAVDFTLRIDPVLPAIRVAPVPLAVPPDGIGRNFTVRLSNADAYPHVVTLATVDPAIATVSPASVTIPAGETEVRATIAGRKNGSTSLRLTSPHLGEAAAPLYVTGEFAGINTSQAAILGVERQTVPTGNTRAQGPIISPSLGVSRGAVIAGVSPSALSVGTGPTQVTVRGSELHGVTRLTVEPGDGLALGATAVSPDGTEVVVPITVAEDAATTERHITLHGREQPYLPVRSGADRLLVTLPQPELRSIAPLFGRPGDKLELILRGRNLQYAGWLEAEPGSGLVLGAPPQVSADGSVLTTGVAISPAAPIASHVISVVTPAGTSSTVAGASNVFSVVNEIRETVTPVVSGPLGLVKETAPEPPSSRGYSLAAPSLGIAKGPVITGVQPGAGSLGESLTLTFTGSELGAVSAVEMQPSAGLDLGTPLAATDGRSLTVSAKIDANAAPSPRQIRVKSGSTAIPKVPQASVFLVTLPEPRIDSVSPLNFAADGSPRILTLRGRNLREAAAVRILPPDDITVSVPPAVNGDGTEASVELVVAAAAARGQRLVTVRTPAGETADVSAANNTIRIVDRLGAAVTPVAAPLVGVVKDAPPAPQDRVIDAAAPNLGVRLEPSESPEPRVTVAPLSPHLGVVVGAVATRLDMPYRYPGMAAEFVISGHGLQTVAAATVLPPTGLDLGVVSAVADGGSVSVPFRIAADSASGFRSLRLWDAMGAPVPFVPPDRAGFDIGVQPPRVDSIDPILADQGEVVTLLVRGAYLAGARVHVDPAAGIELEPWPTATNDGTELSVRLRVVDEAPTGTRIVRVETSAGTSSAEPHPSNIFTVYPKP